MPSSLAKERCGEHGDKPAETAILLNVRSGSNVAIIHGNHGGPKTSREARALWTMTIITGNAQGTLVEVSDREIVRIGGDSRIGEVTMVEDLVFEFDLMEEI